MYNCRSLNHFFMLNVIGGLGDVMCTFTQPDLCGYSTTCHCQSETDKFQWLRWQGDTPSDGTGPSNDISETGDSVKPGTCMILYVCMLCLHMHV